MVIFGGLTHCGRRRLNPSNQRFIAQSKTYQSERKENTNNQERGHHYCAAEEASAGFGTASPSPQVLLTLGSPTPEAFLSVTAQFQCSANIK
jgi:hypothetical protein